MDTETDTETDTKKPAGGGGRGRNGTGGAVVAQSGKDLPLLLRLSLIIRTIGRIGPSPNIVESAYNSVRAK